MVQPAAGGNGWTETVPHDFTDGRGDGIGPAGVIMSAGGTLYGATVAGRDSDSGTVYQLVPQPATSFRDRGSRTVVGSAFQGGT